MIGPFAIGLAFMLATGVLVGAADRSSELTTEERDAFVLADVQNPPLETGTQTMNLDQLPQFNLERLKKAPVGVIVRFVLDLVAGRQIDTAFAVISSLPVETAAQALSAVAAPARIEDLSPLVVEQLAQLLIDRPALIIAFAEYAPDSFATVILSVPKNTAHALAAALSASDLMDAISPSILLRLGETLASLADLQVHTEFEVEQLFAILAIKRLSPGFTSLSAESHFGQRLRQLEAQARQSGSTPELRAQIAELYRDALDVISRKLRRTKPINER